MSVGNSASGKNSGSGSSVVDYSLRHAKNIERKMMGELFGRLVPIAPLTSYRYIGFGSEFFNDFLLYHQLLGIRDMISIEKDPARIDRCRFNQPYKCIEVRHGTAADVLPELGWNKRSIVWLDYLGRLNKKMVDDIRFVVSRIRSGSMGIWTVNAHPWGGEYDPDTMEKVKGSEWPQKRLEKLRALFGSSRKFHDLKGNSLAGWGLAKVFHEVISDEVQQALNDRNAAYAEKDQLEYRQCFHFRYADSLKMLTVGGLFINKSDREKLNDDSFGDLDFFRDGAASYELTPPTLTSREIRYLSQKMPQGKLELGEMKWLNERDAENFKKLYRYYPIFAESEL